MGPDLINFDENHNIIDFFQCVNFHSAVKNNQLLTFNQTRIQNSQNRSVCHASFHIKIEITLTYHSTNM